MTTNTNHHARQLRAYLEAICSLDCPAHRMPRWSDFRQSGRALVGMSLAVTACGGEFSSDNGSPGGNGSNPGGAAGQAATKGGTSSRGGSPATVGGHSAVGGIGTVYGMPLGGSPPATGGVTARGGAPTGGVRLGGNGVIAGMRTLYCVVYAVPAGS